MTESAAVLRAVVDAAAAGRPAVLATIVSARGSTPRGVGSRMLIEPGIGLTGTVGGGCGEAEVIRAADDVVATGRSRVITVDLTEDILSLSPAVCGGVFEILLEPIADGREAARPLEVS